MSTMQVIEKCIENEAMQIIAKNQPVAATEVKFKGTGQPCEYSF